MMKIILMILAVEAVTQLICKAEIFDTARNKLSSYGWWFQELLRCPYCVSVWSALFIIILSVFWNYTYLFILLLVIHRMSNFLHDIYSMILHKKINIILKNRKE